MATKPTGISTVDITVAARRVLLSALAALRDHADGVIVVGAQAIYLRAEQADLSSLSSFTSDADLGIDPRLLQSEPKIEDAMTAAGFALSGSPGTWSRREGVGGSTAEVMVDLLVPEALGGTAPKKARGGRIPPHASTATRQVRG